jgi:hypothetical protein
VKRTPKALLLSAILFGLLPACAGPSPASGALIQVDTNGDGQLDETDLDDGQMAIVFQLVPEQGEPDEDTAEGIATLDATITPGGSMGWYLTADLTGRELSVRFEAMELIAEVDGAVTNASFDVDDEHFAYAGEPGASVLLSDVAAGGASASGRMNGELELEVFGMNEAPTGETIRIDAFAFKGVNVESE